VVLVEKMNLCEKGFETNYTQFSELMISMTSRYVINVRHFAHAQSA